MTRISKPWPFMILSPLVFVKKNKKFLKNENIQCNSRGKWKIKFAVWITIQTTRTVKVGLLDRASFIFCLHSPVRALEEHCSSAEPYNDVRQDKTNVSLGLPRRQCTPHPWIKREGFVFAWCRFTQGMAHSWICDTVSVAADNQEGAVPPSNAEFWLISLILIPT